MGNVLLLGPTYEDTLIEVEGVDIDHSNEAVFSKRTGGSWNLAAVLAGSGHSLTVAGSFPIDFQIPEFGVRKIHCDWLPHIEVVVINDSSKGTRTNFLSGGFEKTAQQESFGAFDLGHIAYLDSLCFPIATLRQLRQECRILSGDFSRSKFSSFHHADLVESLPLLDYVFCSVDEWHLLSNLENFKATVSKAETQFIVHSPEKVEINPLALNPAEIQVQVANDISPLGAGDTFAALVIESILGGENLVRSAQFAVNNFVARHGASISFRKRKSF